MSTRIIPSWLHIPGMVSVVLMSEGLFVQNKSSSASSLVVRPSGRGTVHSRPHKIFFDLFSGFKGHETVKIFYADTNARITQNRGFDGRTMVFSRWSCCN